MVNSFLKIVNYEIKITFRQGFSWMTPLLFFIIVVCLFPLALGPDSLLLAKIAPSIIWVAALLAILLSIDRIFSQDAQEGFLESVLLGAYPLTLLIVAKIVAHWIIYALPLVVISPVLAYLLHLSPHMMVGLVMTLLLGTPVLSLLGAIGAALTIGIRGHGLLLPILIMPLYIPILIFGTGTLTELIFHHSVHAYFAIMGALLLFSLAFAPIATSMALRIGVNQ